MSRWARRLKERSVKVAQGRKPDSHEGVCKQQQQQQQQEQHLQLLFEGTVAAPLVIVNYCLRGSGGSVLAAHHWVDWFQSWTLHLRFVLDKWRLCCSSAVCCSL